MAPARERKNMKRRMVTTVLLAITMSTSLLGSDIVIAEREVKIGGKYLLVPVSKTITPCAFKGHDKAMQQQLDVFVDGTIRITGFRKQEKYEWP